VTTVLTQSHQGVVASPASDLVTPSRSWETELFVLRGDDRPHLRRNINELTTFLAASPEISLSDLAFTINTALSPEGCRLAIVAGSLIDLRSRLGRASERLADPQCQSIRDVGGIYFFDKPLYPDGRVAILFPGEGAQYLNMLKDLYPHFPEVRERFDDWDRHAAQTGRPNQTLARLLFVPTDAGVDEKAHAEKNLRQLGNAMLSVLVADWTIFQLLQQLCLPIHVVAGHSMGEFTALCAAGCVEVKPSQLDRVLSTMETLQRQEEQGTGLEAILLAVGAGRRVVAEVIRETAPDAVYLAMDNCPHQSVVVGPPEPMRLVESELLMRRIMHERLPFRRPYHTKLFRGSLNDLDKMFDDSPFRAARTLVYSCTTARPFPSDPEEIRRLAVAHWAEPVEFVQLIENMYADGIRLFVESGPRGNLSAFVEDILRGRSFVALPADIMRRSGITQLNHLCGQLAAHHVPLNLAYLYQHRQPQPVRVNLNSPRTTHHSLLTTHYSPLTGQRSGRAAVLHQYLGVMDQFLNCQRAVTDSFLARRSQPRAGSKRAPLTRATGPATNQAARGPLVGQIFQHEHGRQLTMRRCLDLAQDLFAGEHTVGGRAVSRVDPDQHGLPVMPMTFTVEMMAEVASLLLPGKVVIGVKQVRLLRWLSYDDEEPTTVEVAARLVSERPPTTAASGSQKVEVEIRDLGNSRRPGSSKWVTAQGTVILADSYPAPPSSGDFQLTNDRPCRISLEVLYRNLFHGPQFQGVLSTDRVGDEGIESQVRVLPRTRLFRDNPDPRLLMDPVLVDVAMHPLAAWHLEQPDQAGRILLPFELAGIDLFGPSPDVGTRLRSWGRIEKSSARHFIHGVDILGMDGRLWCRLTSAKYWRFYVPFGEVNFHGPKDEYFLSAAWQGPVVSAQTSPPVEPFALMVLNPPADIQQPALRLATARVTMSLAELRQYRQSQATEAEQNAWVFERIVAKDAVRVLWHRRFGERLFPADIEIDQMQNGHCVARRRGSDGQNELSRVVLDQSGGVYVGLAAFRSQIGVALARLEASANNENTDVDPHMQSLLDKLAWDRLEGLVSKVWCVSHAPVVRLRAPSDWAATRPAW
jgi:malonyl CoA-acyl carrier protein transacylase